MYASIRTQRPVAASAAMMCSACRCDRMLSR